MCNTSWNREHSFLGLAALFWWRWLRNMFISNVKGVWSDLSSQILKENPYASCLHRTKFFITVLIHQLFDFNTSTYLVDCNGICTRKSHYFTASYFCSFFPYSSDHIEYLVAFSNHQHWEYKSMDDLMTIFSDSTFCQLHFLPTYILHWFWIAYRTQNANHNCWKELLLKKKKSERSKYRFVKP